MTNQEGTNNNKTTPTTTI